ncbi:hypothetical protein, unknown function [Leishmania tarentolae]|uniref:C2HC/C3H-type domain-containing protein n=1 Tax=Leishmania tarentolae TaxID=5689 RepID=A0A640KLR6_LEITA|nr:hypothetical protein, unknown function [Leishmania tarentolae]
MSVARDGSCAHSDGGFDGRSLLSEQTTLLQESTAGEINFIHFLKLRLSAQQRATAQRNYWQRAQREATGSVNANTTRAHGRDGIHTPAAPISTTSAGRESVTSSNLASGRRDWNATGRMEGAPFSMYGAERVMLERSSTSLSTLSKQDALASATPHSALPPPTVYQHSFEDLPAAASKRRVAPASEVMDFGAAPTAESSEGGSSSHRRPSGALAEEDAYMSAPLITSSVSIAAAAAIDERPAMACGKPHVPADVDEMKDVELEPCPHCGRTFAPARLERHVTTCQRQTSASLKTKGELRSSKVVSSRRKGDRAASDNGAAASATATAAIGGTASGGPQRWPNDAANKPEKWRKQSARLRSAMAGASLAEDDDRVPCPSCGRRFADHVAERHISICKSKSGRLA